MTRRGMTALMYHRLGSGALRGRETGEESYAVPPERFRAHLEAVEAAEVPVRSLGDLLGGRLGPGVCITFDDGNSSDHDVALPALRERGWPALSFVVPAWVGTPGYLGWSDIRRMRREGIAVGAHGWDHTWLATLDDTAVRRQLREARRVMAGELGETPRALSLPGGSGGRRALRIAREEGFTLVATSVPRSARGIAPLTRFAVRSGDRAEDIRLLAAGRWRAIAPRQARYFALVSLRTALGESLYARLRLRWAGEPRG